jgi:hypothetical protein
MALFFMAPAWIGARDSFEYSIQHAWVEIPYVATTQTAAPLPTVESGGRGDQGVKGFRAIMARIR